VPGSSENPSNPKRYRSPALQPRSSWAMQPSVLEAIQIWRSLGIPWKPETGSMCGQFALNYDKQFLRHVHNMNTLVTCDVSAWNLQLDTVFVFRFYSSRLSILLSYGLLYLSVVRMRWSGSNNHLWCSYYLYPEDSFSKNMTSGTVMFGVCLKVETAIYQKMCDFWVLIFL
jgi:hypothetical protein